MLSCDAMERLDLEPDERAQLVQDIATRAGKASEIAKWYGLTVVQLRQFVADNRAELEGYVQPAVNAVELPTPTELGELWITNKFERLRRLQAVADAALGELQRGGAADATLLREFRSYLGLAANELGQLLHRGSGDSAEGDQLQVDMIGVDMEQLK